MMPRQASSASASAPRDGSSGSSLGGFSVTCLQKAGVLVQKIVTTTGTFGLPFYPFPSIAVAEPRLSPPPASDLVIPGTNSSTDVQARIAAGESIHIIRGTKGKIKKPKKTPKTLSSSKVSLSYFRCLCVLGTYIRTLDGRIFAIRAANRPKTAEDSAASFPAKSKTS